MVDFTGNFGIVWLFLISGAIHRGSRRFFLRAYKPEMVLALWNIQEKAWWGEFLQFLTQNRSF